MALGDLVDDPGLLRHVDFAAIVVVSSSLR